MTEPIKGICEYRKRSERCKWDTEEPFERLSRVGDMQVVETLKDTKVYGRLIDRNGKKVRTILPFDQPKYYFQIKLVRYGKVMAIYRMPEPMLPMHIARFRKKWEGRIDWTYADQTLRPKGPCEI